MAPVGGGLWHESHHGTMRALTIAVTITVLHQAAQSSVWAHAGGSQEDRWAKEFCKASFCGIMSSSKWQLCCEGHDECCAYLQLEGVGGGGGLRASRGGSFSGLLCLQ
nr:uncharacterized protein LOC113826795 isoform X2 [Penaeus vannamei]